MGELNIYSDKIGYLRVFLWYLSEFNSESFEINVCLWIYAPFAWIFCGYKMIAYIPRVKTFWRKPFNSKG
ncbi:MAG: hypothetical protein [Olavius algarvensis spirochete endosymbiont]|nr:MAG: hypothetical protein [Olavius algarvensis spirochete endosymbiont]